MPVWRRLLEPALKEVVTELTSAITGMLAAIQQSAALATSPAGYTCRGRGDRTRRWRWRQVLASHVRGNDVCALEAAAAARRVLTDVYPRP